MKDFNNTWIKIYRGMLDWEWFSISEMVHLFIYLLIKASTDNKNWRGIEIKRGQLVISVATIHKETHLSEQTIRTCLKRLISTNEITSKTTNKYTLITICNYESYQEKKEETNKQINEQSNNQVTNKQQTSNKQLTTSKEYKNNKEIKEVVKEKEKEKESCDESHEHNHHFLFEVVFDLFNRYFVKKASMENKADRNAIDRIAEICGTEERCNILFEFLEINQKYYKFHVGAFANMADEKMNEALEWYNVREQEKENAYKRKIQAQQQARQEREQQARQQAIITRACEIGTILHAKVQGYDKLPFGYRMATERILAEQLPYEKNEDVILQLYRKNANKPFS